MRNEEWEFAKGELDRILIRMGYPKAFSDEIARTLGSPKAIQRMSAYLRYARPDRPEEIADEMLAIRSEIDAWREKKAAQEANAGLNDLLNYGLGTEDPD